MEEKNRISKQEEINDKCPYTGVKCAMGKKHINPAHIKCSCSVSRNYNRRKLMAELEEKMRNNEELDYKGDNECNFR